MSTATEHLAALSVYAHAHVAVADRLRRSLDDHVSTQETAAIRAELARRIASHLDVASRTLTAADAALATMLEEAKASPYLNTDGR